MTDRTQALKDLLEMVEAGTLPEETVLPNGLPHHCGYDAVCAYNGSLDAAEALHESVLTGWVWEKRGNFFFVDPPDYLEEFPSPGFSAQIDNNPARAWLIAILKALIAESGE